MSSSLDYDSPAGTWNEALPVGNGRLGAMVYGAPGLERVQLKVSKHENSFAYQTIGSVCLRITGGNPKECAILDPERKEPR